MKRENKNKGVSFDIPNCDPLKEHWKPAMKAALQEKRLRKKRQLPSLGTTKNKLTNFAGSTEPHIAALTQLPLFRDFEGVLRDRHPNISV